MSVGKIFSREATRGFFKNFSRGPKVVKFFPKLRKQPFFVEIFEIQVVKCPPL